MQRYLLHFVLAFALTSLVGCGTLNNTIVGTPPAPPHEYTPPLEIYGGVRSDLQDARRALTPPYDPTVTENLARIGGAAILLADVPMSAIGDTLTLNKTIPEYLKARESSYVFENATSNKRLSITDEK